MANRNHNPKVELDIMAALESGDLEMVGDADHFRLTEKGKQEAEGLLLYNTDALQTLLALTFKTVRVYSNKDRAAIAKAFDAALAQCRQKDLVIEQLLAERNVPAAAPTEGG